MTNDEQIEAARAYIALSNAHRLDWISQMFDESASYYSAFLGDFQGKAAILDMMTAFFSKIPDVNWHVNSYRSLDGCCVELEFVRSGTDIASDESVNVPGVERIFFSNEGLISRIEVHKP
ncbi:nuclear transport factor 2 family protein [Endozoicomonas sp. GU-1]|uniref:nuclear transport factor 2 family protein n=1 Tax=Endozoicomonas sp. GU-1 TaxID=3009078 RepID=UPI0022B579E1|nr:nuclear transport factor 2 family protein [Endozoicomonas sp. GU-1]WBA81257.1 nuclear transport factor 2 family protein [Endozoicomonas sp. GU-1]WBA84205.1 nuclear transport factor 2 family protein [Endozoicomonas sp. GU-1]